jgi:hypothetical protein
LLTFLQDLLERGHVRVPPVAEPIDPADKALTAAIENLATESRADLAGDAPAFSVPVATWALALLENACRFLVYREYDAEDIAAAFAQPRPDQPSPSTHYSADLFLHHLPEITRLARGVGQADPLVDHLLTIAHTWPLSSVGIEGVEIDDKTLAPILSHPTLSRLYVDRIIDRNDTSRAKATVMREAIAEALGAHQELAPQLARTLESSYTDSPGLPLQR